MQKIIFIIEKIKEYRKCPAMAATIRFDRAAVVCPAERVTCRVAHLHFRK